MDKVSVNFQPHENKFVELVQYCCQHSITTSNINITNSKCVHISAELSPGVNALSESFHNNQLILMQMHNSIHNFQWIALQMQKWYIGTTIHFVIIEVYELKYTIDIMLNYSVWKITAKHPSPKVMADILDTKINIMP